MFITLCEYLVLGTGMYFAFGAEMDPSKLQLRRKYNDDTGSDDSKKSLSAFICDILKATDVFFTLNLIPEGSMSESLIDNKA